MTEQNINIPEVVAEVTAQFHAYEAALMANDVARLNTFFWDSALTTRYGIADRQWGSEALRQWRASQLAPDFTRTLENLRVSTFDRDTAVVQVEFLRSDTRLRGFQSQAWRRFDTEWKIVAAHVSMIEWKQQA